MNPINLNSGLPRRWFLQLGALSTGGFLLNPAKVLSTSTSTASTGQFYLPGLVHSLERGIEEATGLTLDQIKKNPAIREIIFRTFRSYWKPNRESVFDQNQGSISLVYNEAFRIMKSPFQHATKMAGLLKGNIDTTSHTIRGYDKAKRFETELETKTKITLGELKKRKDKLTLDLATYRAWKKNGIPFERIPGRKADHDKAIDELIASVFKELRKQMKEESELQASAKFLGIDVNKKIPI